MVNSECLSSSANGLMEMWVSVKIKWGLLWLTFKGLVTRMSLSSWQHKQDRCFMFKIRVTPK